ncbi:MAG: hypothetical protein KTR19_12175 [Hyphomicrobiales bacterium]|nr:hypothetical protein [Hyphomicrobiales bacterium]
MSGACLAAVGSISLARVHSEATQGELILKDALKRRMHLGQPGCNSA